MSFFPWAIKPDVATRALDTSLSKQVALYKHVQNTKERQKE